ncbi:MAG: 3-phosphoshikimate 1-carboxyvinyltransferase [Elusimicrobia bacterium]|nr:3-phosphoshikimate 1-carboxyvinyltransferase [Elusimicrobiota bacterium]
MTSAARRKIERPARFSGSVDVPPDKSITHRAVMLSALAEGESTIDNPLAAADCLSTVGCVSALGAAVDRRPGRWTVRGVGLSGFKAPKGPLDCGNSGTTMRLLSGILAGQPFETTMAGDASLSKRPMGRVADPLRAMGAQVDLTDGKFAPMKISGRRPLTGIRWKSAVASAQVKSCVLLAGLFADGEMAFEEPSLSRDHTERMLSACGVAVSRAGNAVSVRRPARLDAQKWTVPGDISSAAFFLTAGAIVPKAAVRLTSVNLNPTRTGILDVFAAAGAKVRIENERVAGGEPVGDLVIDEQPAFRPFNIDRAIAPRLIDEVPVLAVAATQAHGTSFFRGLEELRVKETDRLAALATNLRAMGADVEEQPDGLIINGPVKLNGAAVSSFDDHRIAMAFAVAGLVADGQTEIEAADCVAISFPTFWETLDRLSR